MSNDPNIVIMVYRIGKAIYKVKDHFEILEPKIADLEAQGIEVALFALEMESSIDDILLKSGAKRQSLN